MKERANRICLQCFLSIPALLYLIVVPIWTRLWRFANTYAYAGLDVLFTILWLAAFASVASWQAGGVGGGDGGDDDDDNDGDDGGNKGGCQNFAYGSAAKCETAKASVGFGVVICLLFAVTSAISVYAVLQYRKTGAVPKTSSPWKRKEKAPAVDDPNDNAWSSNTDELDPNHPSNRHSDDEDPRARYGQLPQQDDEERLLNRQSVQEDPFHDTQTEHGAHPGRPMSYSSEAGLSITAPPSYHEQAPAAQVTSPTGYIAPSALSPSDYEQTPGGRINFPQGNYGADFNYR